MPIRRLQPHLAQGALHQIIQFREVLGEGMVLQAADHRLRKLRWSGPAEAASMQADHVPHPIPEIRASDPQRRHPDRNGKAVEVRQAAFGSDDHSPGEPVDLTAGHRLHMGLKVALELVHPADQQGVGTDVLENPAPLPLEVHGVKTHQQASPGRGAEVNQGRKVVLFQPRLTADQHRSLVRILRSAQQFSSKPFGVATGADDAPAGPSHGVGRKPLKPGDVIRHGQSAPD